MLRDHVMRRRVSVERDVIIGEGELDLSVGVAAVGGAAEGVGPDVVESDPVHVEPL